MYNIFYKEIRKKILAERGYIESSDEEILSQSPPKKRGRPRGPNYQKKKKPHHVISFQELTKEVAIRWESCQDEYNAKYGAMVEEQKKKYKAEKKARENQSEWFEAFESNETSVENDRFENLHGSNDGSTTKWETSSDHDLQLRNCTSTSTQFISRHKNACEISQSEKDSFCFEDPMRYCDSQRFHVTDERNASDAFGEVRYPEKLKNHCFLINVSNNDMNMQ